MSESSSQKQCAKCSELIQPNAKVCKHCKADLRNWFVKHKIISIILALFVLGIIVTALGGDSSSSSKSSENTSQESILKPTVQEEVVSRSFDDFSILCDINATNLQKQDVFTSKFKDKHVQWSGTVSSISQSGGSYTLQIKHCPTTFVSDVVITMKDDQKDKLLPLKEGDKITYTAKLTRLGDILGLSAQDGEIVE